MLRAASRALLLLVSTALLGTVAVLPATAASAADAPRRPEFGAQFHGMWSSYDDTARARYLDQMATSGATWVRLDVSWAMLQPTSRDSYDLRWGVPFVDRVVRMITSRGLKPLVTLWLTPDWANNGAGSRVLPTDPADYANAARWAAARWAAEVPAWEIWNEPNHPDFMVGTDPVAYTRLLQAVYPAIKAGNPDATVVYGGPSGNDSPWIAKTYAAGAKGYFDAMATHPYQAVADLYPEAPDDGTKYRFTHLAAVHRLMVANGDGDKPIWATEFGWSSHPNDGTESNWERGVTEAQQADYAVRALKLVESTMPYVTHMFWYTDRNRVASNAQNSNYGIFYNDLTPKPIFHALKAYLTTSPAPAPAPTASASAAPALSPSPTATATAPTTTTLIGPSTGIVSSPSATTSVSPSPSKSLKPFRRRSLSTTTTTTVYRKSGFARALG